MGRREGHWGEGVEKHREEGEGEGREEKRRERRVCAGRAQVWPGSPCPKPHVQVPSSVRPVPVLSELNTMNTLFTKEKWHTQHGEYKFYIQAWGRRHCSTRVCMAGVQKACRHGRHTGRQPAVHAMPCPSHGPKCQNAMCAVKTAFHHRHGRYVPCVPNATLARRRPGRCSTVCSEA